MLAPVVKRVIAVLVLMLVLDGLGVFPPGPACQDAQVGAFSCFSAVELAMDALPARTSIARIQFMDAGCVGPLLCSPLGPPTAVVVFTFPDPNGSGWHTRSAVGIYLEGGRMVARFSFSEKVRDGADSG